MQAIRSLDQHHQTSRTILLEYENVMGVVLSFFQNIYSLFDRSNENSMREKTFLSN